MPTFVHFEEILEIAWYFCVYVLDDDFLPTVPTDNTKELISTSQHIGHQQISYWFIIIKHSCYFYITRNVFHEWSTDGRSVVTAVENLLARFVSKCRWSSWYCSLRRNNHCLNVRAFKSDSPSFISTDVRW